MLYGISVCILKGDDPQFVGKIFNPSFCALSTQLMTTVAYPPSTNGQAKRNIKTVIDRLRHPVSERQKDWDDYIQTLTDAYNAQGYNFTCITPFRPALGREPFGSASTVPPTVADNADDNPSRRLQQTVIASINLWIMKLTIALQRAH